jgi:hypothetical protein
MELQIQNKKLGKNYIFDIFSRLGFDTESNKHPKIKKYKFNIINLGTLKRPIPTAVLEKQLFFDDTFRRTQVLNEQRAIANNDLYYNCISEFNTQFYGDYSYFAPFKIRFNIENTMFFKTVFQSPFLKTKNVNFNTPFVRLNFPANLSNTTSLSGINSVYTGAQIENSSSTGNNIQNINYYSRNTFVYTGVSGLFGYLPYPQTVTSWSYPKYAIDSVLSINSLFSYPNNYNDMNGLLVISTGDNNNQEIVYVSPHEMSISTGHTVIENVSKELSRIQPKVIGEPPRYVYKKISSGINVSFLDIDSQYFSGNIFESGLTTKNNIPCCTPSVFELKSHIKQLTPLKDTLFYKFYNFIYSSNKKIATGTWDGVIPANTNFTIEYITTKNQYVGTNNEFKLFYKNYGDNSPIDIALITGFFDGQIYNNYGYGTNVNKEKAIAISNNNLRRNINRRYNQYSKNISLRIINEDLPPISTNNQDGSVVISYQYNEVNLLTNNKKYRSFVKFQSGVNNL